jgi:hypothetical protein
MSTMLTCKWGTADDGTLCMQWTEQKREEKREEECELVTDAAWIQSAA